jgi:hypothetical protein
VPNISEKYVSIGVVSTSEKQDIFRSSSRECLFCGNEAIVIIAASKYQEENESNNT